MIIWRNFDEGGRAGSKARPKALSGGTGPRQGNFAGGENPPAKFMQMRVKFSLVGLACPPHGKRLVKKSIYFCPNISMPGWQAWPGNHVGAAQAWPIHGLRVGHPDLVERAAGGLWMGQAQAWPMLVQPTLARRPSGHHSPLSIVHGRKRVDILGGCY